MSEEQLKAFLAKVQADTSLQEQLKAEGADPVAIAKTAGFAITEADMVMLTRDLNDEELEAVAGGAGWGKGAVSIAKEAGFWNVVCRGPWNMSKGEIC